MEIIVEYFAARQGSKSQTAYSKGRRPGLTWEANVQEKNCTNQSRKRCRGGVESRYAGQLRLAAPELRIQEVGLEDGTGWGMENCLRRGFGTGRHCPRELAHPVIAF